MTEKHMSRYCGDKRAKLKHRLQTTTVSIDRSDTITFLHYDEADDVYVFAVGKLRGTGASGIELKRHQFTWPRYRKAIDRHPVLAGMGRKYRKAYRGQCG
jgi:hypothetical protein